MLIKSFCIQNDMKTGEKIRFLLNEWYNYELPDLVEREIEYDIVQSKKIITFVGVRRAGKTYLQFQIIKHLLGEGIPKENIIYFNFEDERLYPLNGDELTLLLPAYFENYNPKKGTIYLFLDEIQNIPYWSKWVRRVYDKEKNIKIFITGSSAKLLSKISTTINVYPMNFREFLKANKINFDTNKLTEKQEAIIKKYFKEYLLYGGFPEIIFEKEKNQILQEYYNSIFYHDIIERYGIKNLKLLDLLLGLLISYSSKKISFTKLERIIKSMGYKVSKATLIEYANYAQKVFLIFLVPLFSYKIKDILLYPKKVYCIDTGLANAMSIKFRSELWALYENMVFVELLRRNKEVYYWKEKDAEVDFIIKRGTSIEQAIQVSYDVEDSATMKREIRGITKAMDEFNLKTGLIITKDYENTKRIKNKTIQFVPIYKWLLKPGI